MNPTKGDLYVDIPLTMETLNYIQLESNYIASRVFKPVPVALPAGTYKRWKRGAFLRAQMRKRADGAESPQVDLEVETGQLYNAEVWSLKKGIGDQSAAVANAVNWPQRVGVTRFLTQQALLLMEKEWVRRFMTTGVWSITLTGVTAGPTASQFLQFNQAASNPITIFRNAALAMQLRSGQRPNTLVISQAGLDALLENAEIQARTRATQRGVVDIDWLKTLLDIDEVFVPQAIENTAVEGASPDETYSFVMGNDAALLYVPSGDTGTFEVPAAGYMPVWTGYLGAQQGTLGSRMKQWYDINHASEFLEIEAAFDFCVSYPDYGVFFDNVI